MSIFTTKSDGANVRKNSYIIAEEDQDVAEERNYVNDFVSDGTTPDNSKEPVLVVHSLHKEFPKPNYKGSDSKMVAVKNLTFKVKPGEVLGLLGPNGAGKSTTMNIITAELTPGAGMVRYRPSW